MKRLTVFLTTVVLLSAVVRQARAGVITGPVFNPENGDSYYLLSQSNWTDAEAQAIALGGHLATIRNAVENQWVLDTFGHYGGNSRYLWIGLYDDSTGRHWADGEPVSFTNWEPGEPSGGLGEPYTLMYPDTGVLFDNITTAGEWDDWTNTANWARSFGPALYGVAEVATVPEPAALTLLGIGITVVVGSGWRRRKPATAA